MRKASSREKILKAASELFHERGFQQTSVDEIVEKSKVTKSNFYYHFKSKEELALEILDARIKNFEEDFISSVLKNPSIPPAQRLENFYKRVEKLHQSLNCRKGCPFGNLAIEMSDLNEKFRIRLSRFFKSWESALENCVREGIERGEFRKDIDPKLIASLILSQIEGAIMMVKTHKTTEPIKEGAKAIINLILTKEAA
ncbi:MAG: putative HTH-type transcriptional regulator YxaF [Deltaproteobacteria bacterium]|jgi:TetR/AcrR family transcriptional repressor of nem operon|nr:MAG: putative HTH-type transcriptional regulator YxaF [Deltaproteobacteria bacterium]